MSRILFCFACDQITLKQKKGMGMKYNAYLVALV